jgi:hypothetical protein
MPPNTKSGVFVWEAATGHERHLLPVVMPYGASAMDISPDGAILAAADYRAESDEGIRPMPPAEILIIRPE